MARITILASGTRCDHSCSEIVILEGEIRPLIGDELSVHEPYTHLASGKVVEEHYCPRCHELDKLSIFGWSEKGEDHFAGWPKDEETLQQ